MRRADRRPRQPYASALVAGLPLPGWSVALGWTTKVGESQSGYSITVAPLAVKDRIIVGLGGGEFGIRGAIAAYDAVLSPTVPITAPPIANM